MAAHLTRHCGGCDLCCRLLPVRSLGKGGGERCKHQRFSAKGECCKVYASLVSVAPECALWTCRWLINDDAAGLSRPDRSHYVIDVVPDFIRAYEDDGALHEVPVVQVWIDPKHPNAHRDPALRAWLDRNRLVALIRRNAREGFVLFPPSRMESGEWMEKGSVTDGEAAHSAADVLRVLAESGEDRHERRARDEPAPVRGRDRVGAGADGGGVDDLPAVQLRQMRRETDVC